MADGEQQAALELLQAVLRRDEAAVRAAVAARSPLAFHGVTALHMAALADWGAIVPVLVAAGELQRDQTGACLIGSALVTPRSTLQS